MDNREIAVSTLDGQTELAAEVSEGGIKFHIRTGNALESNYDWALEAINDLRSRGYDYAEDLVRLTVNALSEKCYAA